MCDQSGAEKALSTKITQKINGDKMAVEIASHIKLECDKPIRISA